MTIFNIFSKRQKLLRGDIPDVYSYDVIPEALRVQIIHIMKDGLGGQDEYLTYTFGTRKAYTDIVDILCREYGLFRLSPKDKYSQRDFFIELSNFFLNEDNYERVLDVVEISFRYINLFSVEYEFMRRNDAKSQATASTDELNARFQEHGIGYRYEDGEILRIDSEFIHAEVVKPALALLRDTEYQGAQAEFLKAHEHYRHGRTKDVLSECLKSFESVMKAVCIKRKWTCDQNATSKTLINVLFDKELIPQFWSSHFTGLRATLEGGVPTARNRLGGHGQGTEVVEVPHYIASYVLHQTAAVIVFLVQAEKALT